MSIAELDCVTCKRRRRTGSNIPSVSCVGKRARRREREQAERLILRGTPCAAVRGGPGGAGGG
jgi:hypothetical protein